MSMPNLPTNASLYGTTTPTGGVASGLVSALSSGTSQIALYTDFMTASGKATKDKSGILGLTDLMKSILTAPVSLLGMLGNFMEQLGVFEPIMDILTMLFEMFAGTLLEALMPAIMSIFNAIMSSGILDIIIKLAEIIGIVLKPVLLAISLVIEAMSPLWEILSDIMGSSGFQMVMLTLGKIVGTIMMVAFIPLIWIIYGVGVAVAALMDLFMNIITLGTWGWQNTEAWNAQMGTMAVDMTSSIIEGVGELWAMELETEETTQDTGGDTYINVHVTESDASATDIASEIDRRNSLGR